MTNPQIPKQEPKLRESGFFSIFPTMARLCWRYGRKLFSIQTLVVLDKKYGAGSGERTVEHDLLDQALQRNKHHYHVTEADLHAYALFARTHSALGNPILVVKKGGRDERNS